ncbi:MAG: 23S rRNA (guanosine(2251)-2'-O)-methyltransferase RlmB [Porticoccus sp.]|nr:23S rRNA (guanosine(2251)-2'-O)-methyltransferase RlmB [Porticoccus sp.]
MTLTDSEHYIDRKNFYEKLLTIYGKKPVLEALENPEITFYRLHIAQTKKISDFNKNIITIAKKRGVEIVHHTRQSLSRISKNINQDQGVAADLKFDNHYLFTDFMHSMPEKNFILIALDGITNPQNLGMIIRSVTASPSFGLLLPNKGNAALSPLVIKASAGAIFKSTLIKCCSLESVLPILRDKGFAICALSGKGSTTISEFKTDSSVVYVLGNETKGISKSVSRLCTHQIKIPMNNQVESLNVSVVASLVAFHPCF